MHYMIIFFWLIWRLLRAIGLYSFFITFLLLRCFSFYCWHVISRTCQYFVWFGCQWWFCLQNGCPVDSSPCFRENLLEEAANNMTSTRYIWGISQKNCFVYDFCINTLSSYSEVKLILRSMLTSPPHWLRGHFKIQATFCDDSVCKMDVLCI